MPDKGGTDILFSPFSHKDFRGISAKVVVTVYQKLYLIDGLIDGLIDD